MSGYPALHVVKADEFADEATSYTTAGVVATSVGGAEAALTSWVFDTAFTFVNGYLYQLATSGGVFNTDTAGTTGKSIIRVRKGVNTTSGLQLLYTACTSRGGSDVETFSNFGYVKNVSGADISTSLGLTVQRASGAANNSLYGDSNIPLIVSVARRGLVASLGAGITSIAVSIT